MNIPLGEPMPGASCQNCGRNDRLSFNQRRRKVWIACDCGTEGFAADTLLEALTSFREEPVIVSTGTIVHQPPSKP